MDKLKIDFTNCFGIESLDHEFEFSRGNTYLIYARNGLMKTSFSKTFQMLQQGNDTDICDKIFGNRGSAIVSVDGKLIDKNQIFVIKSYESSYESDISSLLIKGQIQEQLRDVFKARTRLLKALEKDSGMKIKRTSQGKVVYELEPLIVNDFGFTENSILLNLDSLVECEPDIRFENVPYSVIFDPTALRKIQDKIFQEGIAQFISSSEEIYASFGFLEKGNLTLPTLKDLKKALEKDAFFVKNNSISLSGEDAITDIETLNTHIEKIETKIQESPAYQAIEKMLGDVKGSALKDVIEVNPELIEYLAIDKLGILKTFLWGSYLKKNEAILLDLYSKYRILSDAIESVQLDDTPWKKALDIFNQRFTVPFSMNVANLKGSIMGESVPKVEFTFSKGEVQKTIDRNKLEEVDTLSQGEKRALYLLNIIFDIEQLKAKGKEVVLIIDDIADSFDYKNKYAIIEYLYELAQVPFFYLIILTHNFDFHRTVSSRLNIDRSNCLMADLSATSLTLEQERYQRQPFNYWRKHPNEKYILALIPFVRNLIEYGRDQNISGTGDDFTYLTSLLHEKPNTRSISFAHIEPLYQTYIGVTAFEASVERTACVLNKLYDQCEAITDTDKELENKIILAIGIRHKAEEFMISNITGYTGILNWRNKKHNESGAGSDYLSFIATAGNQTRHLLEGYRQFGDVNKIGVLNEVSIMTPEHIHINSFMYEPLLDMDITELLRLFNRIKML